MFYSKQIDLLSRNAMEDFLTNHFRYYDGNHYANRVKIPYLGLTREQQEKAWEMQSAEYWDEIADPIHDFTEKMDGQYTIISAGRNNGYLTLCKSERVATGHLSRCSECGQLNYAKAISEREVAEALGFAIGDPRMNFARRAFRTLEQVKSLKSFSENHRVDEHWTSVHVQKILAEEGMKVEGMDRIATIIGNLLPSRESATLGNACGRCHADARYNLTKPIQRLHVKGHQSIEPDGDITEWSMEDLRRMVHLVQSFDAACDSVRESFIELLETCETETIQIMVPQTVTRLKCRS